MSRPRSLIVLFGLLSLFGLSACSEKIDTDFIDPPKLDSTAVAYVPVQPFFTGFAEPVDVLAGFDELIYVVDAGTDEIVQLDRSGRELGRLRIPGVKAVAQDLRLDLLALGTVDTVVGGETFTLDAIYRIRQTETTNGSVQLGFQFAEIVNTVIHPFYFKPSFTGGNDQSGDDEVRFVDLDVLANNHYYVTRTGPIQDATRFGGPDDAILEFSDEDEWVQNVGVSTDKGIERDYFDAPRALATFLKPPQSFNPNISEDFLVTMIDPSVARKTQFIERLESQFSLEFRLNTDLIVGDTSQADGFLYEPNRFVEPLGLTLTGDGTNRIFVTDATLDSVYLFSINGLEGVDPPPAVDSDKNINVSFGGTGDGPLQFREPMGVTHANEVLYVADKGNGRIGRFKLTTDLEN